MRRSSREEGTPPILHSIRLIFLKDLQLEARRRYELISMFAFATISVFSLSYALGTSPPHVEYIVPTIIWITILFVGMFAFSTVFIREMDMGTIDGLRLLPSPPHVILLGKSLFCFFTMGLVEVFLIPLSMFFFNYSFKSDPLLVIAIFILGTLAIALIGTVVSALTMYAESKMLIIPLLTFPLILGALFPSITATIKLAIGTTVFFIIHELWLIFLFIIVTLAISWLTFEYVLYE